MRLLIVDDDTELCSLLKEFLEREGYSVQCVHEGREGLEQAQQGGYDLIIQDVMLPGLDGFEILKRLRAGSKVPVLMLTARGEDVDRILGLELGADDYLPKPFNPRELVARIRAILRRTQGLGDAKQPVLQAGGIELDTATRTVRQAGVPVELTSVEFGLLEVLLRSAGQVVTREKLAATVLGRKFAAFDRSID